MTGSENFKFKHKYEYEENLFKNEDAIYTLDHQILCVTSCLNRLIQEQQAAEEWSTDDQSAKVPYKIKHLTRSAIEVIEQQY